MVGHAIALLALLCIIGALVLLSRWRSANLQQQLLLFATGLIAALVYYYASIG